MSVTTILPTLGRGRPGLARALASIEIWPGDEILLVCGDGALPVALRLPPAVRVIPCPPGGNWGHTERNVAMPLAKGTYLAHLDDDDVFTPGTRAVMEELLPAGRPVIFKMQYAHGGILWQDREIRCGNVGTPMFFTPNDPRKLGVWGPRCGGDCDFLVTSGWAPDEYLWHDHVVAQIRPGSV